MSRLNLHKQDGDKDFSYIYSNLLNKFWRKRPSTSRRIMLRINYDVFASWLLLVSCKYKMHLFAVKLLSVPWTEHSSRYVEVSSCIIYYSNIIQYLAILRVLSYIYLISLFHEGSSLHFKLSIIKFVLDLSLNFHRGESHHYL